MVDSPDNEYQAAEGLGQLSRDSLAPDAEPLCPQCLKPVNPLSYYCPHCGSNEAINPLTPYIPFVRIPYMYSIFGKMWRKLWDEKTSLLSILLYIPLMVIFAPIILIAGAPVVIYKLAKYPRQRTDRTIAVLIIVSLLLVLLFLIWLLLCQPVWVWVT